MATERPKSNEVDEIYESISDELLVIIREILTLEDQNIHLQQPQSMAEKIVRILEEYVHNDGLGEQE